MGMRKHALITTSMALRTATERFSANPGASNWLTLEACMRAHQLAYQTKEPEMIKFLANCKTTEIVDRLSSIQQTVIDDLAEKVADGRAKVFREPAVVSELRA